MKLGEWLGRRVPPVPSAFRPWIARELSEAPDGREALTREAVALLERASEGEGARDEAFQLLVADALVTWACEAALQEEVPEVGLEELLRTLAE
ncbi:MAG: hypothetical protein P8188_10235 [Gemmatimonadota bacterium]